MSQRQASPGSTGRRAPRRGDTGSITGTKTTASCRGSTARGGRNAPKRPMSSTGSPKAGSAKTSRPAGCRP